MLREINNITRTFYPVGQGAFYREKFVFDSDSNSVFNIVYDCGTKTAKGIQNINDILEKWDPNEDIDILFISHFHNDHISNIKELAQKIKIKTLIMPFLTDDDKNYYKMGIINSLSLTRNNGKEISKAIENIEFINNPIEFISKNKIDYFYFIAKEKDIEKINDNVAVIPEGNLLDETKKLDIFRNFHATWVLDTFVSYKFDRKQIINEFESKVCKICELNKEEKIREILSEKVNDIKHIYKNDLNEKSLVLYSGPIQDSFTQKSFRINYPCFLLNKPGCLYMGDFNASRNELYNDMRNHYRNYYKDIGVLQLSHHGSIRSFNDDFLNLRCIYVACAGEKNQHKHPSYNLVNKIIGRRKKLFIITENSKELIFRIHTI